MKPRRRRLRRRQLSFEVALTGLQRREALPQRRRRRAGQDGVHRPPDLLLDPVQLLRLLVRPAETSACSLFHVSVKPSTNALKISGSISRSRSAASTVSSSTSRRMVRRFVHAVGPLLRAVEQPKCVAEILEKPPPQSAHLISPEKR